ncbi:MAG: hypothetical protein AB8B82_02740 [Roseovarius sp.]
MLDLFLFVLAAAINSSGGSDTAVAVNDNATVIVEEAAPEVAEAPEVAPEVSPEAEPEMAEEMTAAVPEPEATTETEMATLAQPEAVSEAEAEPATSDGGSWNVETSSDTSWITNRSDSGETAEDTADIGNSLLAGVVQDVTPSLGAEESFVAEPQIPSGKFTTATEIKPILAATKGSWVALRDYDGQDYLYVTHLWAWRCGLHQMRYSINGGPMQVWPLPPCHENTNAPNAIIDSDGLPYTTFPAGSVKSISVELLLDDMSEDASSYVRTDVLMPG